MAGITPERAKALHQVGQGLLGLVVLVGLIWGLTAGWAQLPWVWLLIGAAVGFTLMGTADAMEARDAGRTLKRIDAWGDRFGEEE